MALIFGIFCETAEAQTSSSAGSANAASPSQAGGGSAGEAPQLSCAQYDRLLTRAEIVINETPTCARLTPQLGGLRHMLADEGIGVAFTTSSGYTYDVLGHNATHQLYNGQDPNWNTSINAFLTYDLARVGFSDNAQLTIAGEWVGSNYQPANAHLFTMTIFAVNQPLFNRQVELEYGYLPLIRAFYGITLGGNASTAALGPSSVVPFEVGMSASEPTPTFDLIVRDPSLLFYNSAAVTRSLSPSGLQADNRLDPTGFDLTVPEARALFIDEFGYKRAASASANAAWLRAAVIYNTTGYTEFKTGAESANNYESYLAATYQLTNPHGDARGWYLDSKLDYSPADRNAINKAFQMTAFAIGPFAGRPADMLAFGVNKSYFSSDLRSVTAANGGQCAVYSLAVTASYAWRVVRGAYLISGLTYTKNPVFAPVHPDALLFQETLNLTF